jgi:hypothetical protein
MALRSGSGEIKRFNSPLNTELRRRRSRGNPGRLMGPPHAVARQCVHLLSLLAEAFTAREPYSLPGHRRQIHPRPKHRRAARAAGARVRRGLRQRRARRAAPLACSGWPAACACVAPELCQVQEGGIRLPRGRLQPRLWLLCHLPRHRRPRHCGCAPSHCRRAPADERACRACRSPCRCSCGCHRRRQVCDARQLRARIFQPHPRPLKLLGWMGRGRCTPHPPNDCVRVPSTRSCWVALGRCLPLQPLPIGSCSLCSRSWMTWIILHTPVPGWDSQSLVCHQWPGSQHTKPPIAGARNASAPQHAPAILLIH